MEEIKKLPDIQKRILKKMILDHPKRPENFSFQRVYKKFDYKKYEKEEIFKSLENLVNAGFFIKDEGYYIFTRDNFLKVRSYFRYSIFFNDVGNIQILIMLFSIILIISYSTKFVSRLFYYEKSNNIEMQESKIENKYNLVDKRLTKIETIINDTTKISNKTAIALEIENLKNDIARIKTTTNNLTSAIGKDPSEIIELSTLHSEIKHMKNTQEKDYDSIKRELDRISGYNTTIIIFMITFIIAFFGLGLINLFKQRASS